MNLLQINRLLYSWNELEGCCFGKVDACVWKEPKHASTFDHALGKLGDDVFFCHEHRLSGLEGKFRRVQRVIRLLCDCTAQHKHCDGSE